MRTYIFFLFLLTTQLLHAQGERKIKDSFFMEPTPVGLPDGDMNSIDMDVTGGKVVSADGKIELIFPAGALTKKTKITIQPVTNVTPDNVGKGYDLGPTGLHFEKPVQLVFHYSDSDMKDGTPQLMGVATQNEKGIWYTLQQVKLDTVSKTITGNIRHFSFWSLGWSFTLKPDKTRVKVSKSVTITAMPRPIDPRDQGQRIETVHGLFGEHLDNVVGWYANGALDGDETNGRIMSVGYMLLDWDVYYKAPAKVPSKNPVEIMLYIRGVDMGLGDPPINMFKRCYIKIYDNEYKVNMVSTMTSVTPLAWTGGMTYKDQGSFVISLDKENPEITDIENNFEIMKTMNCNTALLNPGQNTGMIHVTGSKFIKVTPANPPEQPLTLIEIAFIKAPIMLSKMHYDCPPPPHTKGRSAGVIPPPPIFASMPAYPQFIKFYAKDEEQVIQQMGEDGGPIYLKVTVKKLNDD
jgi:hypothetical protein